MTIQKTVLFAMIVSIIATFSSCSTITGVTPEMKYLEMLQYKEWTLSRIVDNGGDVTPNLFKYHFISDDSVVRTQRINSQGTLVIVVDTFKYYIDIDPLYDYYDTKFVLNIYSDINNVSESPVFGLTEEKLVIGFGSPGNGYRLLEFN